MSDDEASALALATLAETSGVDPYTIEIDFIQSKSVLGSGYIG